jgi:hypothetical protein
MFLSLDLPARFPVCYSFYFVLHFIDIWLSDTYFL